MNQRLYGVSEEQNRTRGLLRRTTAGIVKPDITEVDRGFLQGIYGDAKGESEYQNMVSDANRRQSDLYNTFHGSRFESGLRSGIPISSSLPEKKYVRKSDFNAAHQEGSADAFEPIQEHDAVQYPVNQKFPSSITNNGYYDNGNLYAYSGNKTESKTKTSGSYIPLRSTIEGFGGKVQWDNSSKKAKVTLDGYTVDVYQGDGKGSFIQNDTMYVWDEWFFPLIGMGIEFELGKGWVGRIEQHGSNDGMKRHVVVYKNGEEYAQNDDGSPHDGTKGNPPKSVLKALKEKKGWDWDGKQNDWLNKIQVRKPDGYTIYVDYPDGSSIWIPYGNSLFYHTPTNKELIEYYSNPPIPYPTQNSTGDIVPIWFIPNLTPMPVTIPTPTLTPAPIFVP